MHSRNLASAYSSATARLPDELRVIVADEMEKWGGIPRIVKVRLGQGSGERGKTIRNQQKVAKSKGQ